MSAATLILLVSLAGLTPTPGDPAPSDAAPGSEVPPFHELEQTRVTVRVLEDDTYVVEVENDPDWLLQRLEPFSGAPLSGRLDPGPRDARLSELEETFSDRIGLFFDGTKADVRAEYVPPGPDTADADRPPRGTMRLVGELPEGAETFRWSYGLVMDAYPLRLVGGNGRVATYWVVGEQEAGPFELSVLAPMSFLRVVRTYLALGFTHILPKGLDHILFVLGIFLLSPRLRPIVAQVTTFTLAHTLTLALTVLDVVSLPPGVVEPLIALSIVYVAAENLITSDLRPWRLALVFGFGLLHGMGFAGVLRELGLPPSELGAALVSFNVGVELGQLTVIGVAFGALGWARDARWYRRRAVWPLSAAIAGIGLYWTVTRIGSG